MAVIASDAASWAVHGWNGGGNDSLAGREACQELVRRIRMLVTTSPSPARMPPTAAASSGMLTDGPVLARVPGES